MASAGRRPASTLSVFLLLATLGCATPGDGRVVPDTLGVAPENVQRVRVQARKELVENSGVTMSAAQPGILFTINDSGNEPRLFALDTTGADRGAWRVAGARNADWEALSVGPCSKAAPADTNGPTAAAPNACLYIGDTGDNDGRRPSRTIYRVSEPAAQHAGFNGSIDAQSVHYRYSDRPHDVEAMFVAPNGNIFLITKRPLRSAAGLRRPALVFEISVSAWGSSTAPALAALVDSLPIVPGSADRRQITDAALSPDGRLLAVRTYEQTFVFATDSATGRLNHGAAPGVCNLASLGRWQGEGIAWYGRNQRLVLSSEGQRSPLFAVDCPMPETTR